MQNQEVSLFLKLNVFTKERAETYRYRLLCAVRRHQWQHLTGLSFLYDPQRSPDRSITEICFLFK